MPLQKLSELMKDVARTAVMPYFLKATIGRKTDGTLFTEADMAAQNAFAAGLRDIIDCPMLGEEMPACEQKALWQQNDLGLWVVDPLDGSKNFANGLPHFALSAAFVRNGRTQLGAVYNPVSDELFCAERGCGAFLNNRPLPLNISEKPLIDAIAGVEVKYLRSGKLAGRIQTLSPVGSRRSMGSSTLDWCYLASGRYDVYVHGGQKLWDYAAGALIYEEAGGTLATLEGDEFWSGNHVFHRSVIAALHPVLFERWLNWIRANR